MITAFYVRSEDDIALTGPVNIEDGIPYFSGNVVPLKQIIRKDSAERETVLIVDAMGMQRRNMDDSTIRVKVPGHDIWYMTCIETEDDVFDGFLSNGEALLMPYHMMTRDDVLEEAFELSDSCIPVLFISKRKVIANKRSKDIQETIREIEDVGFSTIIVFDTDDSLSMDDWRSLHSEDTGIIPYVREDLIGLKDLGFKETIVDNHNFG